MNDNWLATFEDEQHALEGFKLMQDKYFNDKKIKVEIKSDTLLRNVSSISVKVENPDHVVDSIVQPKIISIDELKRDNTFVTKPRFL